MPTYVILSNVTGQGAVTLAANPARITEVNKEIEKLGAKVKAQFAVLGPYDFVTILEAPDNPTMAHVSSVLSARGTVRLTTLVAVPVDEFVAKHASDRYQPG